MPKEVFETKRTELDRDFDKYFADHYPTARPECEKCRSLREAVKRAFRAGAKSGRRLSLDALAEPCLN